MTQILTPKTLFDNFDSSQPLNYEIVESYVKNEVVYEHVYFYANIDKNGERIKVYGLHVRVSEENSCVMVVPNSNCGVDLEFVNNLVLRGYNIFMFDYRGFTDDQFRTEYPESMAYANVINAKEILISAEDGADNTCWYVWTGMALYAFKFLELLYPNGKIGAIGIRDGGEIVWKLATIASLSCAITISAAGWRGYENYHKYGAIEPEFTDAQYRFIAGLDSQAYAPYVKCPMLMLCTMNDKLFDYDNAYDTFLRINKDFIDNSVISFSIRAKEAIDDDGLNDLYLFLDKNVLDHQIFIPRPPKVNIVVDDGDNLLANIDVDDRGIIKETKVYLSEDNIYSLTREWVECQYKEQYDNFGFSYYLNVFSKSNSVFVLAKTVFLNGFTVWSRISYKKLNGKFRNMQNKNGCIYNTKQGNIAISINTDKFKPTASVFYFDDQASLYTKLISNVEGVVSNFGFITYNLCHPRFSAEKDSLLKIDFYTYEKQEIRIILTDTVSGEEYVCELLVVDNVWQSLILDCKMFKHGNTILADFIGKYKLTINCNGTCAINNIMWL